MEQVEEVVVRTPNAVKDYEEAFGITLSEKERDIVCCAYWLGYERGRKEDVDVKWVAEAMSENHVCRGRNICFDGRDWRLSDTGEIFNEYETPCRECGLVPSPEGHDGCIRNLPGVQFACCGHGKERPSFLTPNIPAYPEVDELPQEVIENIAESLKRTWRLNKTAGRVSVEWMDAIKE